MVDDCSTDDTPEHAESAGATVIRQPRNQGVSVARNTGVEAATQPWIAFLDSDDRWLSHHLGAMWPHTATPEYGLIGTSAWAQADDGTPGRVWGVPETRRVTSPAEVIAPANLFVMSGALVRRDLLRQVGGFNPDTQPCEDLDAWIRLLERGDGLMLDTVGVAYQFHEGSVSIDRSAMRQVHRAVALSYSDRPWFTSKLRKELDAAQAHDDLREAAKERRYSRVPGAAWRTFGGGRQIAGLRQLRRHRRRLATRSRTLSDEAGQLT